MPETLLESELFGHVKGAFTGAISNKKGLFEIADKGTVFLDEIGSIPVSMQSKLLRTLQEKEIRRVGGTENIPFDARIVVATNEKLEEKIAQGLFREDLFYRLSVIPIKLPPLRDRSGDIQLLVSHFLEQFNRENERAVEVSKKAMEIFLQHKWPGNVRELENTLKRAATLCESNQIMPVDMTEITIN
jgi:two-component system response regulator PilR (NtrC family)